MTFNSKALAKKLEDVAEGSRRESVTEGFRKDALKAHIKKLHRNQFDYAELLRLFQEQLEMREARSKMNRNMLNSLNGYRKRTTDAYINVQWKKHVASNCRNNCWPNLPPIERRGKGKQREAVMPSAEEMENHRIWFVKRTKSEALRRERAAKMMYQNGGEYQTSDRRHSCRDSESDSGRDSEQESSDEGSPPSEREIEAEETSPEVEDASTPRGDTSVLRDEGSAWRPGRCFCCVIPEEGPGDVEDASAPCVVDCVVREECPRDVEDAGGACLNASVGRVEPPDVSEPVRDTDADGSLVPVDSPVASDTSRVGLVEAPVVPEELSVTEEVAVGVGVGASGLVTASPDVVGDLSVRVEETPLEPDDTLLVLEEDVGFVVRGDDSEPTEPSHVAVRNLSVPDEEPHFDPEDSRMALDEDVRNEGIENIGGLTVVASDARSVGRASPTPSELTERPGITVQQRISFDHSF
ncbi:hypothetical protein K3495_g12122 [Podosphaera aphanis]|nr:hypothetical protein K3495_g12122 [Podosphaera aphanis]